MNRRKKSRKTERKLIAVLVAVTSVYVLATLSLNAVESSLNIEVQSIQEEIEELKAKKDGLNTARQEKISFDSIVEVAKAKGYTLNFGSEQVAAKSE